MKCFVFFSDAGFSSFPQRGLPGGVGGNSTEEVRIRQAIRTIHLLKPQAGPTGIQDTLWRTEGIRRSLSTIRRQLQREGCPIRVTPRTTYQKRNVARDKHFLKLVVGTLPLLKDGTRRNRHSTYVAMAIINGEDEKYDPINKRHARRVIDSAGYFTAVRRVGPGVTANNNTQRKGFHALTRRFNEIKWQGVAFSDAHTLSPNHVSNPRNDRIVIKKGTTPPAFAKVRRNDARVQPTLHVYGCLTRYGMCGPYFVEGKLNSSTYQSEVLDFLIPDLKAKYGPHESFIFMQDGAGEHVSKDTQKYLRKTGITFWPKGIWPGNSPDLNPIEGFWSLLRSTVTPPGQYGLSNVEMRRRATLWFNRVTIEQCRTATSGMVGRMRELSANNFWSISH